MKTCDHKSVGMLVWRGGKLLMIKRAKFPAGMAVPAGHVDADATYEDAARRELSEEVGLVATSMKLIAEGRMENPSRREDRGGRIDENDWQREPGLEPVMYDWFKKLHII